jgi:hypothetical protein
MKKINLEIPSDPVKWRCTRRDRPVKSLDGGSKQRRKEVRGSERKREGKGRLRFLLMILKVTSYSK